MIQPLNGNVKINRFTDNRLILVLLLIVLLLLTVIVDDKFDRPKVVEFYDGLKTHIVKTYETDVDSFLRSQNISLAKGDILLNSLSEPLADSMEIRLIKVSEEIIIEEEPLAYKKIMQLCEALAPGEIYELRSGAQGLKKNYYKVTYHNMIQKSRQLLGEVICEKPRDQVVLCGKAAYAAGFETSSWQKMSFNVVVAGDKNSRWKEELKNNGAMFGIALVASKIIHEGSLIEIEGYGKFIVKNDDSRTTDAAEASAAPNGSAGETHPAQTAFTQSAANIKLIMPDNISKNLTMRKRNVKVRLI